ncbi:MAG: hypothetical protein K0Q59_4613 [Paenibacillus sp.]|jgi:hypothetical protein|nr:hypothetical protein [Paenibacillus sp.]
MERPTQVAYGYEPQEETSKGTLFVYDSFECVAEDEADEDEETAAKANTSAGHSGVSIDGGLSFAHIQRMADWAERRMFARIVLYVPHEETLKRMGVKFPTPMYKREEALREAVDERLTCSIRLDIEGWERKRKKYTPIDMALRYMGEHYRAPYFIGMSGAYANRFASYQPFEEWIRKVRLIVAEPDRFEPHPLLVKHQTRWSPLVER